MHLIEFFAVNERSHNLLLTHGMSIKKRVSQSQSEIASCPVFLKLASVVVHLVGGAAMHVHVRQTTDASYRSTSYSR